MHQTNVASSDRVKLRRTPWFYQPRRMFGDPSEFLSHLIQTFGDFVHYRGPVSFYLVNDPDLVKVVLHDTHRTFNKDTIIYRRFRAAFGNGLVNAEGADWRRRRRRVQKPLRPDKIEAHFETMKEASDSLVKRWAEQLPEGGWYRVDKDMTRLTLDIVGHTFFSHDFTDRAEEILHWSEIMNEYCSKPPIPILNSSWMPTPMNRKLRRTLGEFHSFVEGLIRQRMANGKGGDLLSSLLSSYPDDERSTAVIRDIADEVLVMITGGHETSATALTWLFDEMGRHPAWQAKLVEEVEKVTGGGALRFEHLCQLPVTMMILQEVLRLHPPFWFENRAAMVDLELAGERIPAGSMIAMSRYALHRHPAFWSQPHDFDPQRFSQEALEDEAGPVQRGAYIPFSAGPRICVGRHFAMMELAVVATSLLRRFTVELNEPEPSPTTARLTLTRKGGLTVRLQPRTLSINHPGGSQ